MLKRLNVWVCVFLRVTSHVDIGTGKPTTSRVSASSFFQEANGFQYVIHTLCPKSLFSTCNRYRYVDNSLKSGSCE